MEACNITKKSCHFSPWDILFRLELWFQFDIDMIVDDVREIFITKQFIVLCRLFREEKIIPSFQSHCIHYTKLKICAENLWLAAN